MSSMPGAGRGDDVDDAAAWPAAWRLATRPWVSRYSAERGRGRDVLHRPSPGSRWSSVGLPSSSTTSTRSPRSDCRARQNGSYRGLPNPALAGHDGNPGGGRRTAADPRSSGGTCAQTSDRPSHRAPRGLGRAVAARSSTAHATSVPPTTPVDATAGDRGCRRSRCLRDLAPVDVLQVSGLFDEIVRSSSISDAIDRSEANGSQALILQMNSQRRGRVDRRDDALCCRRVADAKVADRDLGRPVQRRSRAYGLPAQLFGRRRRHRDGRRAAASATPARCCTLDGVPRSTFGAATDRVGERLDVASTRPAPPGC